MRVLSGVIVMLFAAVAAGCSDSPGDDGFAGLAKQMGDSEESGFLQPRPGNTLTFPEDWGSHPQHRIEWWYLTANLETPEGKPVGVQWTQFRQALQPRAAETAPPDPGAWPLEAAWMAHGAVSFEGGHWFTEKLARGDVGHAGATAEPFQVWLDDWRLESVPGSADWRLQASGNDWSYDLRLRNTSDVVMHGNEGFSAKSASGEGTMYFSVVDLQIEGTVTLADETLEVSGKGWFDREWSSQFLKAGQQGWDWFALHLAGGEKLMAFRLWEKDDTYLSGSWINANGDVEVLGNEDLTLAAINWRETPQGRIPVAWRLRVPAQEVDLTISAPAGNYWNSGLYRYWESPVSITGSHDGVGYMELTGYSD
ncbi:lipocalin-like domain-containing protein [Marinobacter orientalis]|uniref:Carotenoid 1,2-hydratase n=1 Tax=Marinobacter orientalis TaxID=1928859 RepID=A0A7Y0NKU9_9GAMM|nr:lipocalin-like domain-containing protein [Marinobacter orientalis]NMT63009.1 carotenoid 1,2-hydratase [Marinobacter orientalis]TGX51673.1 carotenoid 1,2-hydratase [Marinobacter orientalis]